LQHCSYKKQLSWKEKKVADCITRIAGIPVIPSDGSPGEHPGALVMEPILGMEEPFHYRNKAQYPVGYDRDGNLVTGFYAGRTHTIIPNTDCIIQHPWNRDVVEAILAFMEEYSVSSYREKEHTGLVRHILTRVGNRTGQMMVCLVINGKRIPHSDKLVQRLLDINPHIESICLNTNTAKTNRILGDEITVLYGQSYIEDTIGSMTYRISPLSFYQVNPGQTVRLYETALEYAGLSGGETVWDLYCGIGTISLFLAGEASQVCGVEIVPQAVEDARCNAELNGVDNARFFVGAAEDVVPEQYEKSGGLLRADVVTIDPPRKGCDEKLLETIVQMAPDKIVYISCDPATLARDLKYLKGHGYALKRVRACDMFGHSAHCEVITCLQKK
jgi:23S rRNA (uracil1939-C5)-methyltransferase